MKKKRALRALEPARRKVTPHFTAFGVGRTFCIGKYMTYQEISVVLARVIWLYDMRTVPPKMTAKKTIPLDKQFPTLDRFLSTHDGPMTRFRLRESQ
jgi:cytochrome P450